MHIRSHRTILHPVLLYFLVTSATLGLTAEREALCLSTDPENGAISMRSGNTTCWTYMTHSKEGKPYFHPLAIPKTVDVFTSHRPPDHLWHLGLWFSWKYINNVNFWEPSTNGVTHVVSQTTASDIDLTFTSETILSYLASGKETVSEKRTVRVITERNGDYTIAWDSIFTARDEGAVFSCTPAKKDKSGNWTTGGYAGLMLRFADNPNFCYTFTNSQGKADSQACGEPSEQIQIIATAKTSTAQARITFRDTPDNPRYPTPWFIRHNTMAHNGRGYYLVGPSMIFHEPLNLSPNESVRFRYTLTVERISFPLGARNHDIPLP